MNARTAEPVLCVAMDGAMPICHTESMLDTWFLGLTPEQKAEVFARFDEAELADEDALSDTIHRVSAAFQRIASKPFQLPRLLPCEAAQLATDHYAEQA